VATPVTIAGLGFLQHRTGDRIKNRYEVLERLGGGNFGSVYRVVDSAVGNVLACKEMHVLDDPATAHDERADAVDLFKREALNLATLRHPHIPAAYFEQEEGAWSICPRCGFDYPSAQFCPNHGSALVAIDQRYYLMMDFIDGQTLEEMAQEQMRLTGRPLDEKQCLTWISEIGMALRSLHRVGILHRDVKPDNIKIRNSDNSAVLLDFGLTKKVEDAGGYGTARLSGTTRFGTPGYAPENPKEREQPERRSDIYALGMTLYRLLSGRDPQNPGDMQEMRDYSPRHFNPSISPEVEHLLTVAIAPELIWRYQTIDDFLADLKAIHDPTDTGPKLPPFTFANGTRARTAGDLARMVESHPAESLNYLFNGMFADWLRLNGFAAPAQVAESVVKKEGMTPPRALEIFRRSLYPSGASNIFPRLRIEPAILSLGSLPSGATATVRLGIRNVGAGLAWGTLSIEQQGPTGTKQLGKDVTDLPGLKFEPKFEGNDVLLEVSLDTSHAAAAAYSGALLVKTDSEEIRVPVSYTVQALDLVVEPAVLDFGTVLVGHREKRTIRIRPVRLPSANANTQDFGKPRGTLYAGASLAGLVMPERFEGEEPIVVTVDAGLPNAVAQAYQGAIQLDTNGGRRRIAVQYRIALPPGRLLTLIVGSALAGAAAAALLRLSYYLINPKYAVSSMLLRNEGGYNIELVPFNPYAIGPLLIGGVGGLAISLQLIHWYNQAIAADTASKLLKRKETRTLMQFVPLFGPLFGAGFGWLLGFGMHWAFWGVGDWMLTPLYKTVLSLTGQSPPAPTEPGGVMEPVMVVAPLMWAMAGGVAGLLWGTARAMAATGKLWARYSVYVVLGLLFLAILINAMLSPGG